MNNKRQMDFTPTQKEAIVSLVIEMINADGMVSLEELYESNVINDELEITQEMFNVGYALDVDYAADVVRRMNDEQKLYVGLLLTRIIDADRAVDEEFELLNSICQRTGIDIALDKHNRDKDPDKGQDKNRNKDQEKGRNKNRDKNQNKDQDKE